MIRVILPAHLRTLARIEGEIFIEVKEPLTLGSVLDELENCYPTLKGTIRDQNTKQRRPFIRFFVCKKDWSHELPNTFLPEVVRTGAEPLLIVGAMAGG